MSRIEIQNKRIKRVNSLNYLGLRMDQNLTWEFHIKYIKEKIVPMSFAINRMKI